MQVCIHVLATKDVEKDESIWISDNEIIKRTYHIIITSKSKISKRKQQNVNISWS